MATQDRPFLSRIAPALTLMFLAPMMAEVLPGATRFSSIFVFPIEMVVWGGGAVLIRAAARRFGLDWRGMLLMALAFAVAEECLIQQTSLAPLVIQLQHREYARAFGVNYVYLLWALVYESVMVVMAPVLLTELMFPNRRKGTWLGPVGLVVLLVLFALGCFLAWFSWTQIARTKVFHLPAYNPPVEALGAALGAIVVLCLAAFAFRRPEGAARPDASPAAWVVGLLSGLWAVAVYALVLLGFGEWPDFPPALAVASGLALSAVAIATIPGFARDPRWRPTIAYAAVTGLTIGSMAIGFLGFIGSTPADFWFKAATNAVAVVLLIALGFLKPAASEPEASAAAS